jgi:methoxymalonate biosynthesis protein
VAIVKCVVWDLDGTIWDGIAVEGDDAGPPPLFPGVTDMLDALEARGVVNGVASRSAPYVAGLLEEHPVLAGKFLAVDIGWGDKSESVRRVAEELGIGLDALAVVDDSPFERAEIRAKLPGVTVLSPEEMRASIDRPPFVPEHRSSESGLRVQRLREERVRRSAEAASGATREEFLESCRMTLTLSRADAADVDRVAELVARSNRLSSSGLRPDAARIAALAGDPEWRVLTARLVDRFGDYGLIGAAFVEEALDARPPAWRLPLFAVSCRVAGRGVAEAILAEIMAGAGAAGAAELRADVRNTEANVELRVLLRACGFRIADDPVAGVIALARSLAGPLPSVPRWIDLRGGA